MIGINITALFATVLVLIVAYAWNDAAKKSFLHILPARHNNDFIKITILYALLMTIFIIVVMYLLNQTNKLYYIYTGSAIFNFANFNNGIFNKKTILSFWDPTDNNGNITGK
jgi:hypothetical protein